MSCTFRGRKVFLQVLLAQINKDSHIVCVVPRNGAHLPDASAPICPERLAGRKVTVSASLRDIQTLPF